MNIERLIAELEMIKMRNPYAEVKFQKEGNALNDPIDQEIDTVKYDSMNRKVILN